MKASVFRHAGGPEVLSLEELPDPIAGPGEAVIRVVSIGVNFADIYRRRGEYPIAPPSPFVLGHEAAGWVESVGPGVTEFRVGERVGFTHNPRSNAERAVCPVDKLIRLPEGVSFDE